MPHLPTFGPKYSDDLLQAAGIHCATWGLHGHLYVSNVGPNTSCVPKDLLRLFCSMGYSVVYFVPQDNI